MDWLDVNFVRSLTPHMSIEEVSLFLKSKYPDKKGLSETNLRRFCERNDISLSTTPISDESLDVEVTNAVAAVGGTYGRKMMTAHLRAEGTCAAEKRVGKSLKRVHPFYHENRCNGTQNQLNPCSYYAPYFGYNLHMDQNEKLVDYGVTFAVALDGCSNYVAGFTVMPKKNNLAIYREVFRRSVEIYGLWDQVVVDHGKEFYLCLFMQHYLRQASSSARPPYRQVQSTVNNRVERIWSEVNRRVAYPIKYALLELEQKEIMSREDPRHLFAISYVAILVAKHGLAMFANDWNKHKISGKGAPEDYVCWRKTTDVSAILPSEEEAKSLYKVSSPTATLSDESTVGEDLLEDEEKQRQRNEAFSEQLRHIGTIAYIFGCTANHNYRPIQDAICLFYSLTEQFAQ